MKAQGHAKDSSFSYSSSSSKEGMLFDNRIWLSTDEAARYLGKTRNALWILVCRGHLLKRKWRRRLFFKKSELDKLLETSLL